MSTPDPYVLTYLTELRSLLRLDEWDIALQKEWEDGQDEDVHASTNWADGHRTITLWVNWERWEKLGPETKKNVLVHELVHTLHRDVNLVWDTAVNENTNISARESIVFEKLYKEYMERFVAWVADRLCEQIELPRWPGERLLSQGPGRGVYLLEEGL